MAYHGAITVLTMVFFVVGDGVALRGDIQTLDAPLARAPTSNIPLHHQPHDEGIVDALHQHHATMLKSQKERADGSIRLHNYKNT